MVDGVGNLDSTYINIINNILLLESQPLNRLEEQKLDIAQIKGAYSDIETKLSSLQTSIQNLISSNVNFSMELGKSPVISDTGDYSVITASASDYASAAAYSIENIVLAQEHQVISDKQTYSNQALELSGTILIGGAAARAQSTTATIGTTVTAFGTDSIDSGKLELGTGTYYVETRNDSEDGWQFRLVDEEGKAVTIQPADGSDTYTSNWQSIPSGGGSYDTGRGLTLTFGADSGTYTEANRTLGNAAELDYTAQGASITIDSEHSLIDIASLINAETYAEGNGVTATVIDNQLMLSSDHSGEDYTVMAEDSSGTVLESLGPLLGDGSFKTVQQNARNSTFEVNGLEIERSTNIGLDDVISGVTLNLAADAEGRSATLTINDDTTEARGAVDNFIEEFNSVLLYIEAKTSIEEITDGNETTYERGILTNETIFSDLRTDLMTTFFEVSSNDGLFESLREIGITLNDSLMAEVSDADALTNALTGNMSDVNALFDDLFGEMDTLVERFTESDGYLDTTIAGYTRITTELETDISTLTERLYSRKDFLVLQYAEMQAQLMSLQYAQQQWAGIAGSVNSLF